MTAPPDNQREELQRRGRLVMRTLPILLIPSLVSLVVFAILAFADLLILPPLSPDAEGPLSPLVLIVVAVVFVSALIVLVRIGRPTISALALIGAWTLSVTVSSLEFGITSYYPALLILPICAAGLLIDRTAAVSLAALATLLVVSIALLDANGMGPGFEPIPPEVAIFLRENGQWLAISFWVGLFWSVAALTALLAGGLQRALAESRARADALRTLSDQLEIRVQQQTQRLLAGEREAATLEERTRLAREIHDTLAQGLAGVVVQISAGRRALEIEPQATLSHLQIAEQLARDSLAEARRSVWNLRAAALDHATLDDALAGLAEQQSGVQTSIVRQGQPRALPYPTEAALLRTAQEALANTLKHSGATHATLTLAYSADCVRLLIHDDGRGFPPDVLAARTTSPESFGLRGMRERLAALGGTLRLANRDGALLEATIPRVDP